MISREEESYLIALHRVKGVGNAALMSIAESGLTYKEAWEHPTFLVEKQIIDPAIADGIKLLTKGLNPLAYRESLDRAGIVVLLRWQDEFPPRLFHLHDVPTILYLKGCQSLLQRDMVAVVGSRAATVYGKKVATNLGRELGEAGFTVVSGLARGIDSCAHRGALATAGSTLGVLGCGVDVVYPPENERLYQEIIDAGLIISEFPPGVHPEPRHFPRRNRIIAALARAVVVVEAGEKSGALITTDLALEIGREVWAVPGPITSPQSRGSNRLIRDGALVMLEASDLIRSLRPDWYSGEARPETELAITLEEGRILEIIGEIPVHLEEISTMSGFSEGNLARVLLGLELKGIINCLPGNHYVRNH